MKMSRRIVVSAWIAVGLTVAFLCLSSPAWSHPGIDEQIQTITARIEQEPDNGTLYLRRGELHRIHSDWEKAEADYRTARKLDSQLLIADYCLGRLKLESGDAEAARTILDGYLSERPNDSDALATRARALVALGQHLEAAQDFTSAIQNPKRDSPRPEYYLERARALQAAGPSHIEGALAGIDEGLQQLGDPVTLQLYAIDLELARKNYDGALGRLDRIASESVRQEPWLVRKGSILEAAGRTAEAREAYAQTLASIDTLPTSRRNNRAVERLETEAREAMRRLDAGGQPE